MELIWTKYIKNQGSASYYLLLYIGEQGGKVIAMDANRILDNDANMIRANLDKVKSMNVEEKLRWLKDNVPTSYNRSLRTFKSDKIEHLQHYSLKELKK